MFADATPWSRSAFGVLENVTLRWGRSFAIKVSARDLEEPLGIRFVLDNGLPWARACEEVLEPHDERMYRQTGRRAAALID